MNPRIKEILDDLAILSQALHSEQENVESLSILGKIKLLSAQLYLESDMELITSNHVEDEKVVESTADESIDDLPIFSFDIDEPNPVKVEPEIPVEQIQIPEEVVIEEISTPADPQHQTFQDPEFEPLIEAIAPQIDILEEKDLQLSQILDAPNVHITQTIIDIDLPPAVEEFVEEPITMEEAQEIANEVIQEEIISMPVADNLAMANNIISKFSLTRRYEFMNFLFSGDMNKFAVFISEILNAPNENAKEDIFSKWHDENQWSRKYETASDLKRNLNKILQG